LKIIPSSISDKVTSLKVSLKAKPGHW